jgi:uncharacterized sporulation protein YeaH/YhbH (DUF444 family)
MSSIFRPYSASDSLRSDRSAGDRLRHRLKVRQAIRENIADIVGEEAILSVGPDHIVKVPIRGIKEYRFVYGDNAARVGAAGKDGEPRRGQVIGRRPGRGAVAGAGDRPGIDYYETDITIEELIDIMFEDLQLPDRTSSASGCANPWSATAPGGAAIAGLASACTSIRNARWCRASAGASPPAAAPSRRARAWRNAFRFTATTCAIAGALRTWCRNPTPSSSASWTPRGRWMR